MADLNIGNSSANVVVNAKHNGSVTPQINNTYDLGTSALRWKNIYASQVSDWYEINKNGTGEGTIVWNRILLLTTGQGDNVENDTAIEFELNGDQNYTYARHGYLFINSYGAVSRSLILTSSGNRCDVYATLVPASATASGKTYVWLGLGGSFTGKARMRILYNGSKNIVYTSSADRSITSTAPNTTYITNEGNLKAGFNSTNNTWSYTLGVNSANGNAHTVDGEHSSAFVHIAGAETVTGTKTFTGNINIATGAVGGVINGSATNGGLNSIRIGDDVWLGDINQGGILGLKADNPSTTQNGFWFYNGAGTNIGKLYADGTNLVTNKSFVPESDLSNNLGTTSKEFKELYVRSIAARHLDADRVISSNHDLYIGYGSLAATNNTMFYYSADNADGVRSRIEYARINNNGLYALTRFGVNGQNTDYNFYVNGNSYQTDVARFVKSSTAAVFGGTLSNISSAIYAPTSGIQLCADSGGTTNSTAIGFHNPGISSAVFGYYQIDENNGQFRMRSDDAYWDLSIGGTTKLTSPWGKANLVVGENNSDKIVAGYLVGNTGGAVIGAHNSALTAWAPVNLSGSIINFREGETVRGKILDGCLSLFPSNSNFREGIRIHAVNSWSDILLCGADNTGDSGTSANSWFLGNSNGNFYITRNGSTNSTASYASVVNNYWQFYPKLGVNGTNSTYNFYVNGTSYFNDNISIKAGKEIKVIGTNATSSMIRFLDNTNDIHGNGISIGGGGVAILGAGESASSLNISAGTESLYLLSDGEINLEANADAIGNRVGFQVNRSGHIIPVKAETGTDNAQNIGATGNRWANIYATIFHGALDGNAATATNVAWSGITNKPSYYDIPKYTSNIGYYGSSDTHILKLGYWNCTGSYDNLTLLISSSFWGNQHGSADIITLRQDLNDNSNGHVQCSCNRVILMNSNRTFYYNIDQTNKRIYLYVYVTGGNSYGKWNTSVLQSDGGFWTSEFAGNQSNQSSFVTINGTTVETATNADTVDGYHHDAFVKKSGDTMSGPLTFANGTCNVVGDDCGMGDINNAGTLAFQGKNGTTNLWLVQHGAAWSTSANHATIAYDGTKVSCDKPFYGAVWNDYAEYRSSNITEPGRVIIENGDGTLSLSTKRLQRGAEIISDTFGFAIGETNECKTPIAVSGRVLAYYSGDIKEFKPGYPVCSGPNGTVSVMTEEEEEKYPSRIIGTVSEIPTYEEWGTGNVDVNGRIWIRIR